MNQPDTATESRSSILPHWDGAVYTRYAARFYDATTTLTGWRKKLSRYALEDLPQGKLLDVGCGTGYLLSLAQQSGFEVTGLDPSVGMLEKAKEIHGLKDDQLCAAPADAMPFEDQSFDVIIASGSLVHIPDIQKATEEMIRLLKPGGRIRVIDHAQPKDKSWLTPLCYFFSQGSGDILHNYEALFGQKLTLVHHRTLGRGGYMQQFDFQKAE